jgi:hypothetical protein
MAFKREQSRCDYIGLLYFHASHMILIFMLTAVPSAYFTSRGYMLIEVYAHRTAMLQTNDELLNYCRL